MVLVERNKISVSANENECACHTYRDPRALYSSTIEVDFGRLKLYQVCRSLGEPRQWSIDMSISIYA
jgi:hypothetical protein